MHVKFPYGQTTRLVDIPDGWVGNRVLRAARAEPFDDLDAGLEASLQAPIVSAPLSELIPPKTDLCLAVDGMPSQGAASEFTAVVLRALQAHARIPSDRVEVLMTRPLEGFRNEVPWPCYKDLESLGARRVEVAGAGESGPYPSAGTLRNGIPLHLHPGWVNARFRVSLSVVEPMLLWGYSGGRTVVLPGLADSQTRQICLGDAIRLADPAAVPGVLRDNPYHHMSLEAFQAAPPNFTIHLLLNREERPVAFLSGDPIQSHLAAVDLHRERFEPPLSERMDIVLSGAGGSPHDDTIASTIRSLVSAAQILKSDGTIVLYAKCAEGIGPAAFEDLLRQAEGGPAGFLQHVAPDNASHPYLPLACMLHQVLSEHEVMIHADGVSEEDLWAFGFTPVPDPMEAISLAMETHGQECKIAVIPDGWQTLGRLCSEEAVETPPESAT